MSVANNLKKHNRDISPMAQYDKNLESNHNLDKAPSETKDTEQNIKSPQSTTQLLELDTFKEYHAAFKETSDYKKLVESKAYKDSKDKDTLIHNAFLAYAKEIEKDKLLYFSLSLNQAPIIIKAPNDNKEQKRFLGYEWSNRKGDEGLKELHSPYLSPLFERDNPQNENKLAHLIRQAFLEISSPIPQDLSPYAFKTKLIDMLDFSKVDFNKAISLNPINSQGEFNAQNPFENCKFELVKLGEVCDLFNGYAFKKTDYVEKSNTLLIRMGNIRPNGQFDPEHKIAYLPNEFAEKYRNYLLNENDVIIAMTDMGSAMNILGVPTLVKNLKGRNFLLNQRVGKLFNFKDNVNISYLKYILASKEIKQIFENFGYGGLQINLGKAQILSIKIPLPPLEIQKQIVAECEKVEEQYNTIRMSIEKYQELIKAILVKCGICHTERSEVSNNAESGDLNNKDFITSLLDSIQELESKLDFDLLANHTDPTTYPTNSATCHTEPLGEVSTNTESNPVILSEANNLNTQSSKDISPTAQYDKLINTANLKTLLDSIPTPPKHGWERVRLGDISIKITKGTTPTTIGFSFLDKGINFVKVESIAESGAFIPHKMAYISKECYDKLERSQLQENDILFSIAGALGRVAVVTKEILPANTNQALAIVRLKPNVNKTHFIRVALHTNDIEKQIDSFKKGIAQQNLSLEQVENLKIPLPPLEAQEKIVSAIDSVESQIKRIDSKLETLETRKAEILANALNANNEREREREQAELKEILSEIESLLSQRAILQHFITKILQKAGLTQSLHSLLDSLPTPPKHGWDTIKLGEIGKICMCKRIMKHETNESGGIPFYKIGTFGGKADSYISQDLYENYKAKYPYPKQGQILISAAGTLGKSIIFNGEDSYFQDSNIVWIDNNQNKALDRFLYLLYTNVIDWRRAGTKGGIIERLYNNNIKAIKIPLPPLEAQEKIINAIENIESKISLLESHLSQLDSKKSRILQDFL